MSDDVHPDDSILNVPSKQSHQKSTASVQSRQSGQSTASACIKAETEKAALLARAAMLKEKQEAELKRKKEQL